MEYTDIISVDDAKNYLRVQPDDVGEDVAIELMIGAAFRYIEKFTNILFKDREKAYSMPDYTIRVYDFPINSTTSPIEDLVIENRGLYTVYLDSSRSNTTLTLNVGYTSVDDVDEDLILVAYKLIELYYYQKDMQGGGKATLSDEDKNTLMQNKRFLL